MSIEEWRSIENYPNYLVSSEGRVKNHMSNRILKPSNDSYGYPQVILSNDGRKRSHRIHRLVANAFIENYDKSLEVNHRSGVKTDNSVSNLEWVTPSENTKHAYRTGLAHRSPKAGSRPTKVRVVETGAVFESVSECARSLGIKREGINACVNRRIKTHRGLHFERID